MRPLYRVLLAVAVCVAVPGVQACSTESPDPGLNPQPLPPEDKKDQNTGDETTRSPGGEFDSNGTGTGAGGSTGSTSSGSSSSGGGVPVTMPDGGTDSGGDN
jgi:hypothetical protein